MQKLRPILLLASALLSFACKELNPPHPKPYEVVWVKVDSWSGHGSTQTDSFDMQVASWRVKWKTFNGGGPFVLTVNSAISGRPLSEIVNRTGPGEGIAYVNDDPRLYHMVVDSRDTDWTITVEQPVIKGGPR